METPTESLQGLEQRLRAILDSIPEALKSLQDVKYDTTITWYDSPYNVGVLMGELDSSVQNIEAQLQTIIERDQ